MSKVQDAVIEAAKITEEIDKLRGQIYTLEMRLKELDKQVAEEYVKDNIVDLEDRMLEKTINFYSDRDSFYGHTDDGEER